MIIGSHKRLHQIQSVPPIILDNTQIKRVKVTKSLGLMIDETLTWDEQVTLIWLERSMYCYMCLFIN